jgi:hypothetical protein
MFRDRFIVVAPIIALLVTGLLALSGVPAFAAVCDPTPPSGHCYAETPWSGQVNIGGKTSLYVPYTSVYVTNYHTEFINQELWVGTNNDPSGATNVEVGYTLGPLQNQPDSVNPRWFWADTRPSGGGYHEHYVTNVGNVWDYQGLWVPVVVSSIGNNSWAVEINGVGVGTSTSNPGYSYVLVSGIESTNQGNMLDPTGTGSLQWRNVFGWTTGWNYNNSHATVYASPPAPVFKFSWYSTYVIGLNSQN